MISDMRDSTPRQPHAAFYLNIRATRQVATSRYRLINNIDAVNI